MEKYIKLEGDYKAIVHSPSPLIPPIFGSDLNTCSEWNKAMEKVTGWSKDNVMGIMLVGEVFGDCCKLNDQDVMTKLMIILHNAIAGVQDTNTFSFVFFDRNGQSVQALLSAHKRVDMDGQIIGTFCFLQIPTPDLQQAIELERQQELESESMQQLAYVCEELRYPYFKFGRNRIN